MSVKIPQINGFAYTDLYKNENNKSLLMWFMSQYVYKYH